MPYDLKGRSVYVKRSSGWVLLKRHATREAAQAHFAALQINVMGKGKHSKKRGKRNG